MYQMYVFLVKSQKRLVIVENDIINHDYVELFYFTAIANTWGGAAHRVYWGGYLL
jgi:hypothetical protein